MRLPFFRFILLALAVLPSCKAAPCGPNDCVEWARPAFQIEDRTIRNHQGHAMLLRGVNARVDGIFDVSFNDGRKTLEPIPAFTAEDAFLLSQWGFNLLRLPINWSALEPEKDRFDDAYVDLIMSIVDECQAYGIYVIIDFHQDAYSKHIGEDGAPLWAIIPEPVELLEGPLHDLDQRRLSEQVLTAFKTFFNDEAGLQDEFADAVAYLDAHVGYHRNVIGIEIFNEPIAGTDNTKLIPFYLKVIDRSSTPKRLWFFEPNVIRNQLDKMPLSPEPFPRPNAVYSPHIYTDVFTIGAQNFASGDPSILEPSMANADKEARAWDTPLFIGEFGIDPTLPNSVTWYTTQIDLQNRFLAHSAFWVWKEDSQGSWGMFTATEEGLWKPREHVVKSISSAYPQEVEGDLHSIAFDRTTITAVADVTLRGEGRIRWAVPSLWFPDGAIAYCDSYPAAPALLRPGSSEIQCPVETKRISLARPLSTIFP